MKYDSDLTTETISLKKEDVENLHHRLLNLHIASLSIRPINSIIATEIPQAAMLTTGLFTPSRSLALLATEVNPLAPLPTLNTKEEKHSFDQDHTPFPGDTAVLEDFVVDNRNVQDGEGEYETGHDSEEQELVAPDIVHPLREVALGVGLHLEEAAAEVHHLPGEEEREPGHACECCGTSAEDSVTSVRFVRVIVLSVATRGEVSIAPAEHDECEG